MWPLIALARKCINLIPRRDTIKVGWAVLLRAVSWLRLDYFVQFSSSARMCRDIAKRRMSLCTSKPVKHACSLSRLPKRLPSAHTLSAANVGNPAPSNTKGGGWKALPAGERDRRERTILRTNTVQYAHTHSLSLTHTMHLTEGTNGISLPYLCRYLRFLDGEPCETRRHLLATCAQAGIAAS